MSSSPRSLDRSPTRSAAGSKADEQAVLLESDSDILWTPISRTTSRKTLPGVSKVPDEETALLNDQDSDGRGPPKPSTGIIGVISVLLLGVFIANADGSIVLATQGTISSETGSLDQGGWLVMVFMLSVCAVQPAYGKLSDIYGRKATLIVAYTLFTIGCAVCGAGAKLWVVILGRAIAGLGGAGMTSLVSVIITDKVPLRNVATWRSYVNIASTTGRSAGGPLGGLLADWIGWRWSFYLQCPLMIVAIVLVAWKLDNHTTPVSQEANSTDTSKKGKLRRIDFLGSISLALTIVGFLLVLDLGGQKISWSHPMLWVICAAAVVCGIAFVLIEAYVAREPIFPLRLFVHRDVMSAYLVSALLTLAQFGVMYTVPLYFEVSGRVSVANAGLHLFPAVCGNAIAGILSGIIINRTASYKLLTLAGCLSSASAYVLLVVFWRGDTNIWQSLFIFPGGFGSGVIMATSFVGLAASVDHSQMAIASTGLYLSSNIGVLVGTSLTSTILQTSLRQGLSHDLQGFKHPNMIMRRALSDLDYVKSLDGPLRDVVVQCYVRSFKYTHIMSLVCAVLAFSVTLFWREHKL